LGRVAGLGPRFAMLEEKLVEPSLLRPLPSPASDHRGIMKHRLTALALLTPVALAAFTACGSSKEDVVEVVVAKGAALHKAESCDDLLSQIHTDAIVKLDELVARLKKDGLDSYYGGGRNVIDIGDDIGFADGEAAPSEPTAGLDNGSDGDAAGGGTTGGGNEEGQVADPSSVSQTNTQVQDVDEADVVKIETDGKRLFVLHGNELKVVATWPAEDTAEIGSVAVPGSPFEMFVHEGHATVFSTVYRDDVEPKNGSSEDSGCYDCCYGGGEQFTQISIFDLSGDTPVLSREMQFKGDYVSSRRHENNVRAILSGGFQAARNLYSPDIEPYDSFGKEKSKERLAEDLDAWRDSVARDIEASTLEDWIPRRFEKEDGSWKELDEECGSYYIPQPGLVEAGMTQVVTVDVGSGDAPQVTSVLGGSERVYANHKSLIVAHSDWRWEWSEEGEGSRSALHRFSLDGASSNYEASGFVPGTLLNQFSIDESGGIIRMATTEDNSTGEPLNSILTVEQSEGELVVMDRSDKLGKPNERIFSARFVGDRAYVVTFENTDPLYAVDMSDPNDISILGELEIPGFSDYMHPLGSTHLVTVGQDAGDDGGTLGFALQLFDVSDPTSPKLVHKEAYGGYSHSEANHNHKAFTYVDDRFGDGEDLLLFPLVSYEPNYESGLEVVKVSTTEGFTRLGMIDVAELLNRDCPAFEENGFPCQYYGGDEVRRGVQVDDFIYTVSQGGVTVHDIADITPEGAPALATVPMSPATQSYYGCGDFGFSTPGDVGIEPDFGEPAEDGGVGVEVPPSSMGGASSL